MHETGPTTKLTLQKLTERPPVNLSADIGGRCGAAQARGTAREQRANSAQAESGETPASTNAGKTLGGHPSEHLGLELRRVGSGM